jgi:exopolysaccharide production protein ExoZ
MNKQAEKTSLDAPPRHAGNAPYRLLDAWRGVAALWVVMLHVRLDSTPGWLRDVSVGGHLGVPMFFVISGYCIANAAMRSVNAPRPVRHFLTARVRRIYPPYLLASGIAALLSLLLTVLVERHVVRSSQIAGLDLLHQNWRFYLATLTITQFTFHTALIIRVVWSLCYEVAFYGLVALLLVGALKMKRPASLLDASAVLTVAGLAWLAVDPQRCPFPWNLWPQFGLGVLVYQALAQPGRKTPRLLFAVCSLLVGVSAARYPAFGSVDGLSGGLQSVFTLAFAGTLLLLFRWDSVLARLTLVRALSWVGLFSYSLYLIHLLALGIVTQGIDRLAAIQSHALLLYGIKLVLCVAAGRLFFQFCERPFLDTRQKQARQELQDKRR